MKKTLFFCLVLSFGICQANDMHDSHHHMHGENQCVFEIAKAKTPNPSKEILDLMHAPMMCEKWVVSGNVERDFLENMIPHHQGAILSSKALLKYAKNEKLRQMAQGIIKTQEEEIEAFKQVLSNIPNKMSADYQAFNAQAKQDMDTMMQEMAKVKPSANVDKDFVRAMIAHHQGAVMAARQILEYTKDKDVVRFAESIIQDQTAEIKEFQELLNNL